MASVPTATARAVTANQQSVPDALRAHGPQILLAVLLSAYTQTSELLHFLVILVVGLLAGVTGLWSRAAGCLINVEKPDAKEVEERARLELILATTDDYVVWTETACKLDHLDGKDLWKKTDESPLYNYTLLRQHLSNFEKLSQEGNIPAVALALRSCLLRNLGGCGKKALYGYTRVGTKALIETYINRFCHQLEYICNTEFPDFDWQRKMDFFFEARHCFGRTALLLSGGAGLGVYHLGVVKALFEQNLLPKVIAGSSVGSLIASIICTRNDVELPELFMPNRLNFEVFDRIEAGSLQRKLHRLRTKGVLQDIKKLEEMLRANVGDVTFKEAYDKTGRILNITVGSTDGHEMPRIMNYLSSPNVLIWSAACASCAFPGLYEPVELIAKDHNGVPGPYTQQGHKWSDGSVETDLPMARLAELFNINYFIVSQVNPHVVPILRHATQPGPQGLLGTVLRLFGSEVKHRATQMSQLGLLRSNTLLSMLVQNYEGDITVVPKLTFDDYARLVSNPTEEFRLRAQRKGQNSTFPYLSMIANNVKIEMCLERCVRALRAAGPSGSSGMARIQSFIQYHDSS